MKKLISILLVLAMVTSLFSACKKDETTTTEATTATEAGATTEATEATEPSELVDGKFVETRQITVEVYDRGNDGGSKPDDNFYANFIKEGMLRDHNVEVTFVTVPRWTEVDEINNLLAANEAPDVCVTYSYPTIQTYANMGGVTDMAPYLEQYKDLLPNLWGLLTDQNIYYDQDPTAGTIWAIEARLANYNRLNTFVRKDWLAKLNIAEPTTMAEFEAMLVAFKDNAELLLGDEADMMIPFSTSYDIGWRADHILASYVPSDIDEKTMYTYGFDDRRILFPGVKDGVAKLNEWYNAGLMWNDFALYGAGDKTEDNLMKAGYVGAFIHNWDYPYREGEDSINNNLVRTFGEDAGYIAVMPFQNDAGDYTKFLPGPVDRKIFFPTTNDEPLASLLYLDWISTLENRMFLQIGEEGVTHEKQADGSVKMIAVTGDKIMNSGNNIDYTITINGLDIGDADLNLKSRALSYVGVSAEDVMQANEYTTFDGKFINNYNFGAIASEEGQGPALAEKRDIFLVQSVVAAPEEFDAVFDAGLDDYLSSGGQAIIDERTEKWESAFK